MRQQHLMSVWVWVCVCMFVSNAECSINFEANESKFVYYVEISLFLLSRFFISISSVKWSCEYIIFWDRRVCSFGWKLFEAEYVLTFYCVLFPQLRNWRRQRVTQSRFSSLLAYFFYLYIDCAQIMLKIWRNLDEWLVLSTFSNFFRANFCIQIYEYGSSLYLAEYEYVLSVTQESIEEFKI